MISPLDGGASHANSSLSERVLRSHVDFLKEAGLLEFGLTGMTLTEEGNHLLQELRDYVNRLQNLSSLEAILVRN